MVTLIISIIIGFSIYKFLRKVMYDTKNTSVTFAIFMFIAGTLLFSWLFSPTTQKETEYPLDECIELLKNNSMKSNDELIAGLEEEIKLGKTKVTAQIIKYSERKNHYLFIPIPSTAMEKIINKHKILIK